MSVDSDLKERPYHYNLLSAMHKALTVHPYISQLHTTKLPFPHTTTT